MDSDGENFGAYDEDDFNEALSQISQHLPTHGLDGEKSSKRKRVSSESIGDFVVDSDDDQTTPREGNRSRRSRDVISASDDEMSRSNSVRSPHGSGSPRSETSQCERQKAEQKKRPRYLIHIPKDHALPTAKVQYATQLPEAMEDPDSSPARIRGPKWVFKKAEKPGPPPAKSTADPQVIRRGASLSSLASRGGRTPSVLRQKTIPPVESLASFSAVVGSPINAEASRSASRNSFSRKSSGSYGVDTAPIDLSHELEGLNSDEFGDFLDSDGFAEEVEAELESKSANESRRTNMGAAIAPQRRVIAVQHGTVQQTLLGGAAVNDERSSSQANKARNYIMDMPDEKPTHHRLDMEALKTWVYPLNLGEIRQYQYTIVSNALFNNTLVALPTGLGKTCIAATVMLNFYRWAPDSQIVFMAPTKPLVAQQVDACFNIVGIRRSDTTMLNGEIPARIRREEWLEKRVFFMTPQTLENDLRSGIADPKRISLLVVDEAHRATGKYAYTKVIEIVKTFNESFRVLALTATPGSSVEAVQEVMDNLHISKIEIRTEESLDIRPFVHRRNEEHVELEPSDELAMIQELFCKAVQPLVNRLCEQRAYYNKDPMSLNQYALVKGSAAWAKSDAGRSASMGVKGMVQALYKVLISVAHAMKLLNFHGLGPFWVKAKEMRDEVEAKGSKGGKTIRQLVDSPDFKKMMDRLHAWINNADFVGHPKLTYLTDTLLNHFLDAGDGRLGPDQPPSATRAIVFCEYRESAEEITRVLNRHKPMIRASVFVGQANTKTSDGMTQDKQQQTINDFKKGIHNVIVATSIGEEGLDIGQVDLIICYDSSASPIRMLQRMGRTGRKRAGNVVLLLMKGREVDAFAKAKDGYEKIQKMICNGERFNFRIDLSKRILPRDMEKPIVDKRMIEIPIENTQNPGLPEPKNRRLPRGAKKQPKKFNYPEGVELGFKTGAQILGVKKNSKAIRPKQILETDFEQQMLIPALETVLLSQSDEVELQRRFQNIHGDSSEEVSYPELTLHPEAQRQLGSSHKVRHGAATKRMVRTMGEMNKHARDSSRSDEWAPFANADQILTVPQSFVTSSPQKQNELNLAHVASDSDELEIVLPPKPTRKPPKKAARRKRNHVPTLSEGESVGSSADELPQREEESDASDLADFIDEEIRYNEDPSSSPAMLSSPVTVGTRITTAPAFKLGQSKPFFELTQFAPTQESLGDDMPDIMELVGNQNAENIRAPLKERERNDILGRGTSDEDRHIIRGKRRRAVIEDSDDD